MSTTYTTATTVKAQTRNTALACESDDTVDNLILRAEKYIDAFCGYWTKYEDSQDEAEYQQRLFPRKQDVYSDGTDNTYIPERVKEATISQVEFLYQNSPDIAYGIEEDNKTMIETVSPRAKELLRGYKRRIGKITL